MTQHVLHGDELAWLELQVNGLVPLGYGEQAGLPHLVVPKGSTTTGATVDLLDPEGVTLARVAVDAVVAHPDGDLVVGKPESVTPPSHPDHTELRLPPVALAPAPARVAIWGGVPSTLAFREAARRFADSRGATAVELVGVPTGRDTDARAHLGARLARRETSRREDDALVVVPWPSLGWEEPGLRLRASIAAAYGATDLLVPIAVDPVTAARITETTGVRPVLPDVSTSQALVALDQVEGLTGADGRLPDWLAEPSVAELLRAVNRPRSAAGFTILLSGLSGSGKSTVARALAVRLMEHDLRSVSLLDGDVVRHHLSKGLGFGRDDRDTNVRRIGFVASEITKAGGIAVCAPIAPYDRTRKDVRSMVESYGGFLLVHIATPLAECERRDRKGLYAKARRGEIPEFTGISDPYEVPDDADLVIDTTEISAEAAVDAIVESLRRVGLVPGGPEWPRTGQVEGPATPLSPSRTRNA